MLADLATISPLLHMHIKADQKQLGPVCKCASIYFLLKLSCACFQTPLPIRGKPYLKSSKHAAQCWWPWLPHKSSWLRQAAGAHWQQQSNSHFELSVANVLYSCVHSLQATTQGEEPSCCCKMRCLQMGMACHYYQWYMV